MNKKETTKKLLKDQTCDSCIYRWSSIGKYHCTSKNMKNNTCKRYIYDRGLSEEAYNKMQEIRMRVRLEIEKSLEETIKLNREIRNDR